jgi:hypothetical protein
MKINEDIEIDIENKYLKNKKNTVFTIEEAIYILKRKDFCDEVEDIAIDRIIKYIKEESIPKAVVEETIEELDYSYKNIEKNYTEEQLDNYDVSEEDYIEMEKREFAEMILQELLNKGE